jgi:hypothetical protein
MVMSVCAAAFVSVAIALGRRDRLKVASSYATLLPLLWVMFVMGAGAYYAYYGSFIDAALGHPMRSVTALDGARAAFVAIGGATSVANEATDVETSMPITAGETKTVGAAARAKRTLRGCAVLFVPISVLRTLSIVTFTGGKGLLVITDIDTLIMDVGIVASLLFLFRGGLSGRSMPVAAFALVLVVLTTFSMAYVVTNFGTLFRLRLLAVTPLWVLPAFNPIGHLRPMRPFLK